MSKDPAFLLYSGDFLNGTADMEPEEVGVYIRLLCYQHQRGHLPDDERKLFRLSGCISLADFTKMWRDILAMRFPKRDGKRVNKRLATVVAERVQWSRKKSILATLANIIKYGKYTTAEKQSIKKDFDYQTFIDIVDDRERKESITTHITKRLAKRSHIEDEDVNEDKDINRIKEKGVQGEKMETLPAPATDNLEADKLIDHLNEALAINGKPRGKYRKSEKSRKSARARLKEYGLPTMKKVVELKVLQSEQVRKDGATVFGRKYCRPETLFNSTKCENYVAEVEDHLAGATHTYSQISKKEQLRQAAQMLDQNGY